MADLGKQSTQKEYIDATKDIYDGCMTTITIGIIDINEFLIIVGLHQGSTQFLPIYLG